MYSQGMRAPLPKDLAVSRLLTNLFDLSTQVKPGGPPKPNGAAAVYVTDSGEEAFFCLLDIDAAAAISAALARIPAGVATEVIRAGTLPDNLTENLHEVLNVIGSLFNDDEWDHIKLGCIRPARDAQFKALWAQCEQAAKKIHLGVNVKGYGQGALSFGGF